MNVYSPVSRVSEAAEQSGAALPTSVIKILEGALAAIISRGSRRLSMSDISDASGVSRGTLYRYFATKDDVLDAVSEFISVSFENGVRAAAARHTGAIDRLCAVLEFFAAFTAERTPDRIFEVEPGFHLDFFRSHFARHKAAVQDALSVTFDYLDKVSPLPVDREAFAEALIRMQLSTLIVPAGRHWTARWLEAPDHLERLISTFAGRAPAAQELLS